jgi:hypothetical protein
MGKCSSRRSVDVNPHLREVGGLGGNWEHVEPAVWGGRTRETG